jgi:L-alanine-DL-glutamate epimerase-like enolase superfamily enzyme
MRATVQIMHLHTKYPFRIARGVKNAVENVCFRVEEEGVTGYGEASPNAYFGERPEAIAEQLLGIGGFLAGETVNNVSDITRLWEAVQKRFAPSNASLCALDVALWDLLGKKNGESVSELLWKKKPVSFMTSYTFALCPQTEWETRMADLEPCKAIKIKSDAEEKLRLPAWIKQRSDARLRIDANCSWQLKNVPGLLKSLAAMDIELVEQPLPPALDSEMPRLLAEASIPVFADESCVTERDVERLEGKFSGVNIKLVKCGGLTPGIRLLTRAKEYNLKVMVGCMLESDVLISAGSALAQAADFADLDGSWLLKDRPFTGVRYENGMIIPSGKPGLGVQPADAA